MAKKLVSVVLDTNIFISSLVFGGKPRQILNLIVEDNIEGVISSIIIAEIKDVIYKKFLNFSKDLELLETQIKDKFVIVNPKILLNVVRDNPDNRILEAAIEGDCDFIVTGDLELLELGTYQGVTILNATAFLNKKL